MCQPYTIFSHNGEAKENHAKETETACTGGTFAPGQGGTVIVQDSPDDSVAVFDERNVTSAANRAASRPGDPVPTMHASPMTVFQTSQSGTREVDTHATLDANNGSRRHNGVSLSTGIRRLTPRECERLQGAEDDFTRWGADGKEISDSARYRCIGNGVAIPCVEWIAKRLMAVIMENDNAVPAVQ